MRSKHRLVSLATASAVAGALVVVAGPAPAGAELGNARATRIGTTLEMTAVVPNEPMGFRASCNAAGTLVLEGANDPGFACAEITQINVGDPGAALEADLDALSGRTPNLSTVDVSSASGGGADVLTTPVDATTAINAGAGDDLVEVAGPTAVNAASGTDLVRVVGGGDMTIDCGGDAGDRVEIQKGPGPLTITPTQLGFTTFQGSVASALGERQVNGAAYFCATVVAVGGPPPPPPVGGPSTLEPVTPARILDTRTGLGGPTGKVAAGQSITVDVTGTGGVPTAGVAAVVLNVTAAEPEAAGYVSAWPTGGQPPETSILNYDAGEAVPGLAIVPVGGDGTVQLSTFARAHLVADVSGWFADTGGAPATGGRLRPVAPARLFDSRGSGPTTGVDVAVTGQAGVPSGGVAAVVLNVTATNVSGAGYVTVWPTGVTRPEASNVNTTPGVDSPNLVIVPVGAGGRVSLFSSTPVDLLVDVTGWFTDDATPAGTDGLFVPLTPDRISDSRTAGTGIVPAGESIDFALCAGPLSCDHLAAVVNVTATEPAGPGYLTVYPDDGSPAPLASNVNYRQGESIANAAVVGLAGGEARVFTYGPSHVVVDASGYFQR